MQNGLLFERTITSQPVDLSKTPNKKYVYSRRRTTGDVENKCYHNAIAHAWLKSRVQAYNVICFIIIIIII